MNGIILGSTLYENQTIANNRNLSNIINRCLNKESSAFLQLSDFWCGGGAGCYDLGYILTQVINRIGENEFINIVQNFTALVDIIVSTSHAVFVTLILSSLTCKPCYQTLRLSAFAV